MAYRITGYNFAALCDNTFNYGDRVYETKKDAIRALVAFANQISEEMLKPGLECDGRFTDSDYGVFGRDTLEFYAWDYDKHERYTAYLWLEEVDSSEYEF